MLPDDARDGGNRTGRCVVQPDMTNNPVRSPLVVLFAAVAAAFAVAGCGAETPVTETSGGSEPIDAAACEDRLDALVDQLKVDVAYDYEPSGSPAELAAFAEAVVTATLGEFIQEGEYVTVALNDVEVISGDASLGPDGDPAISWYVSPEPRDLGSGDGISILAFLDDGATMPQPAIEGLWFACGPDTPARSMIVDPIGPGWPTGRDATLDNLALAVTDPDTAASEP